MKRSLNLAAAAYGLGSTALADAALVLSRRYPKSPWDRKARMLAALSKGGGVPAGFSLWTTNGQPWVFSAQRAISPARPQ